MSRASSVVEINGSRYDASTGQLISSVKKGAHHLKSSAGGVVDGFIRQPSLAGKRKVTRERVKNASQTVHRSAQRSRTLMRTAVSKPQPKPALNNDKRQHSALLPQKSNSSHRHSLRAMAAKQHHQVSRFGHVQKTAGNSPHSPKSGEIINRPRAKTSAAAAGSSSTIATASHSQIERLLDQVLISSHAGDTAQNRSILQRIWSLPKWLSVGTVVLVLAVSAGFFAWQNIPQVAVKVASARASINAAIPSYTPEGYSFAAPISYSKGEVIVRYQAHSGQEYKIAQQASKLDSASLASAVMANEANVQTSQVKGTTIYIYGDNNDATWVNNGVRYTITGQAGLDSSQILKIAGSL